MLYTSGYLKILVEYARCIQVDQSHVTYEFIKSSINVIKQNKVLGIFPEGKRSENGKLVQAYPGVIAIAQMAKVPVVPIGLNGFFDILPKGRNIPRIRKCSVVIGKPLHFKADKNNKDNRQKELRELMTKIGELTNQEYSY